MHLFRTFASASVLVSLILVSPARSLAQVAPNAFVNFEGSQTNPIRISPDRTRLFALNTPDNRLSVFDLSNPSTPVLVAEIPVGIEPVSVNVNPNNSDEAWVVNQESDSVSIVSVSKGIVTDTIYCKDEPSDVVFAGTNLAFVSVSRSNRINVYDMTTHALVKSIPVFGENPRALAVSADRKTVYAAFALSGNHTTILPDSVAPAPPSPTNKSLPHAPQTALIIDASDPSWSWYIKYQMRDNDVVGIDASALTVSSYFSGVGTVNLGLAVRPGTGDLYVSNTNARNLVRFEPNLRGHWIDNRITRIQVASKQITPYDLNSGINYSVLPNPAALATAISQPAGVVFDPSGNFMWVAAYGTDRVVAVDTQGKVLNLIEIGNATGSQVDPVNKRGPRGLALNIGNHRLYVLNRLSNTISIVDTAAKVLLSEMPVGTFDPTPTIVKSGRGFLYDAKLSGNGTGACASCHIDGDLDLLAWDLGDPGGSMQTVINNGLTLHMHPMKGPMTTRSMRGLSGTEPYHWRGDRADLTAFNPAFSSLLGGSQLSTSDMAAYQSFVDTIVFQPNPNQNLDRSLPISLNGGNAVNGQNDFLNVASTGGHTCNSCHASQPGPGSNLTIVQRANLPQPVKVPTLRNIYQKLNFSNIHGTSSVGGFGLSTNGQTATLIELLSAPILGGFGNNPQAQLDVGAFVLSFDTGIAPAVGYTRTITPANMGDPAIASDWAMLQGQVTAGNIDLILKGTINGHAHGLLYLPATNNYETDTTGLGPFTQAQLLSFVTAGDTLSVMGVPVGSGVRMGVDRDLDGVLDGDH